MGYGEKDAFGSRRRSNMSGNREKRNRGKMNLWMLASFYIVFFKSLIFSVRVWPYNAVARNPPTKKRKHCCRRHQDFPSGNAIRRRRGTKWKKFGLPRPPPNGEKAVDTIAKNSPGWRICGEGCPRCYAVRSRQKKPLRKKRYNVSPS